MADFRLRASEHMRDELTLTQQRQIRRLYSNAAKEVGRQAEKIGSVPSDTLRQQYLRELQKQLNSNLTIIQGELDHTIRDNMAAQAEAVVNENRAWLASVGMPPGGAFSHVADDVVRSITTGQVYEGNWSLSSALWSNTNKAQKDIQSIIAQGVAQNKSAYDIAKDLEKYVDPSARKDWEWSKVYPGTSKVVDYNAQRLARTMVSHAYQQAFVQTTQKNPFVTKYRWDSSNSDRTCELCADRDGKLFEKDSLPMDHPNGMCTFVAIVDDMTDVANRLADWAQGKADPELDEWSKDLYGESLASNVYKSMSKDEYTEWQKENSTKNQINKQIESEFGVKLTPSGQVPWGEDVFFDSGPYKGMWLQDVVDKNTDLISTVERSYGCGYVQNADGSRAINAYWRTGSTQGSIYRKSEIEETSRALDTLISSTQIKEPVSVDRWAGVKSLETLGISVSGKEGRIGHAFVTEGFDPMSIADQIQQNLVGAIIEDKGYMSASMQSDLNVFRGSDIRYVVQVPSGTNAFVTENTRESEVVFGRGTKQEVLGAKVIESEAIDYEGNSNKRQVVEITVRILSEQ